MWQAPRYRGINRACLYSSKARQSSRLGLAALTAGDLLAVLCLSFGTVFAAFVPASLDQRVGSLFLFGLIPAVGFHAAGHILSQLLMFSSQLCEMIVACCFRCVVLLVNGPASLKLIRKTACPTSESTLFSSSLLLACPRSGSRLLMSPDSERRSIYYQDAGFPALKRGR
jgi:hypothetical protein